MAKCGASYFLYLRRKKGYQKNLTRLIVRLKYLTGNEVAQLGEV